MKRSVLDVRTWAENYAKQIAQAAQENGIEGLQVLVALALPPIPPQYAINLRRQDVPKFLAELRQQVETENLVLLPGKGRA